MDNLITRYQQQFALHDAIFLPIVHEDATVAIVYKVKLPAGNEFILKICPRPADYFRELYFLQKFANDSEIPVPRVIKAIEPSADLHGAILMEFLMGKLPQPVDFTESLAYSIGVALAQIHAHPVSGYGDLIRPNYFACDPRVHFSQTFYEGLDECSEHLPNRLIEQCRKYFDAHLNLLDAADGPCITHRDFRPGNLIVHEGSLKGVIDWSSARAGFAQEDFCLLEHDPKWQLNATLKRQLLAGYATVRAIPRYSDMMPLLRLNRVIAIIGFTVKRNIWNSSLAEVYQYNRRFLDDFFKDQ